MLKKMFLSLFLAIAVVFCSSVIAPVLPETMGSALDPAYSVSAAQYSYTYHPACASWQRSISDALRSIGEDGSYANRKKIAAVNDIVSYRGTSAQNNRMLSLLKQGRLIKSKTPIAAPSVSNAGQRLYDFARSQLGKLYGDFSGFHWRAWCADFVSYCASQTGLSYAVPWDASVAGLRSKIKKAGGTEYSKALIQNGRYTPKKGDIIIFKSNGASHVGIVDYAAGRTIHYIDGNNTSRGNGWNSRVNYSSCSYSYSKFTCVLVPRY